MRTWEWDSSQDIFLASDGCWIDYIWFERTASGYDAYELHCDIDGVGYRIRLADVGREKNHGRRQFWRSVDLTGNQT